MKKSIIATGAASLALAAMPVVGVFAATSNITDEIEITIAKECAIKTTATDPTQGIGDGTTTSQQFSATMQNGELKVLGGSTGEGAASGDSSVIDVVCNDSATSGDATSWKLTAVGGDGTNASTVLDAATSGTDIVTGTATSGTTSNWAMKVEGATGLDIQGGFDSFRAVPGTAAVVATGNGTKAGAFTASYQVYIGTSQEADTYTGHVTYTLTNPAGN